MMSDLEAQHLLEKAQAGEQQAFLELYDSWKGTVYRFAWQMTGSISMAEDITQEVFLLILRNKFHFELEKGSFSSFIYGVARNLALKAIRKNQRFFGILEIFESHRMRQKVADPLSALAGSETTAHLRRCIQSLPPLYREALVLCDLHELSYSEVAAIAGCAIGTVRSRLHRGRELLIQKMRDSKLERKQTGGRPHEIPAL